MNFQTQIQRFGVTFEIELEYEVDPSDDSTGWPESIEITKIFVLGHYPEGDSSKRDYVPIYARGDIAGLTPAEDLYLMRLCEEHLEQEREGAL